MLLPLAFNHVAVLIAAAELAQGIDGSAHDFGPEGCAVCHTLLDADGTLGAAPLWNDEPTVAGYTPYSSPTMNATPGQPSPLTKLCLSCHDGILAIGSDTDIGTFNSAANLGTDLSDDHPVSFTYDQKLAIADPGLYDPQYKITALGGTIAADLLFDGKVECVSCHDVHNQAGNASLLRISNAGSGLCLTCHNK